jgi:maltooligosyltrehalose trehalohydrolase
LFMGEEWGARTPWQFFTDHTNPDIAAATAAGRKAEFGSHGWSEDEVPDPQYPDTFARSRLDWEEREREPHARLLRWYADLIRLRRDRPDLRDPRLDRVAVTWADRRLRSVRGSCTVLVNLAASAWPCDVAADDVPLLAWGDVEPADGKLLVPARSAVVLGPR